MYFYVESYQNYGIDTTTHTQHNQTHKETQRGAKRGSEARVGTASAEQPPERTTRETKIVGITVSSENHGAWGGQREQRKRNSEGRLARRSEARVRTASAARQTEDRRSARSAREGARVGTTWATTHTSTRRNETLREKGDARALASIKATKGGICSAPERVAEE